MISSGASPFISILDTATGAAQGAAKTAAVLIRAAVARRGLARILVGTGNSQLAMIGFLAAEQGIDWTRVEAFHLDEYVGIPASHRSSFRQWIRTRFAEKVRPKLTHYLEGDAGDLDAMIANYSRLLRSGPIDLAFVGIGENGHIAFNDPHVANFDDPLTVKRVALDETCRRQQVGEGHFSDLAHVPIEAVTVTCSGLFRAEAWVCCVPDARKARAVKGSLEGPVSPECPGSLVRRHRAAHLFLDRDSASLLAPQLAASARTESVR